MERLAELRKLDKFEKNILLTLTGCMVSQNLRDSNQRDSAFRHNLSIGMLVGLFCEGLEEQIRTRVYFYKNSRLVRSDGLCLVVMVTYPRLYTHPHTSTHTHAHTHMCVCVCVCERSLTTYTSLLSLGL